MPSDIITDSTNVFHSTFPTIPIPLLPDCIKNWTKVSYKRSRSPNSDIVIRLKHSNESQYWLNEPVTFNHFAVLQEEEREGRQHKTSHTGTPKPPVIYVTGDRNIQNISRLILLLESAKEQCEIKALTENQVEVQPKTPATAQLYRS
jgi:hypothetical protein